MKHLFLVSVLAIGMLSCHKNDTQKSLPMSAYSERVPELKVITFEKQTRFKKKVGKYHVGIGFGDKTCKGWEGICWIECWWYTDQLGVIPNGEVETLNGNTILRFDNTINIASSTCDGYLHIWNNANGDLNIQAGIYELHEDNCGNYIIIG